MSARNNVWVFYEDSLADGAKQHGLHELVLACVADELESSGGSRSQVWELRAPILGRPKNGNAKVIGDCKRDFEKLVKGSGAVILVLDSDRICECVGVNTGSCKQTVLQAICAQVFGARPRGAGFEIVLLERNAESIIQSIRSVAPALVDDRVFESALKKDRTDRDRVFEAAAFGPPSHRQALRNSHVSFDRLVIRARKRYGDLAQ